MDILRVKERSQDDFYYATYSGSVQRELYEKHFKIIRIVSGYSVFTSNEQRITIRAGEFVFVNRGVFSRIRMHPDRSRPFRMLCLNLTDKFIGKYIKQTMHPSIPGIRVGAFEPITPNPMLEALFASLDIYARNDICPDRALTELKLQECAHILSLYDTHLLAEMFRKQTGAKPGLEEFMNTNYMYNAPLERFAELSGRSLSSFRREFERTFGTTPAKWLMNRRLEAAYDKIVNDGCRPSDIYWELGFETLQHFSRRFRDRYGLAPSHLPKIR